MEDTNQPPPPSTVVIVPTPGMGHLIPLVEFAKRLVLRYNLAVTFFIPTDGSSIKHQTILLQSLPTSISSVFLPPVSFEDLPHSVPIETRITLSLTRSIPALHDMFHKLTQTAHVLALVVDVFGTEAFAVAEKFSVPAYLFYLTSAMALASALHLPKLDETVSCQFKDLPDPIQCPGCIPVRGIDLPDPVQDRNSETYKMVLKVIKRYSLADGILVNSFKDLEPGAFQAFTGRPPVYPVGPLVQSGSGGGGENGSECLRWLDKQPEGSVVYISFGSGGTLSQNQLEELSFGLEMSGQKFIWVLKSPNEEAANASYFNVETSKDPFEYLPNGFLERTKGVGMVVPSWAPQVEILSHGSTGGFVTHCGWNSVLESIVNGVPLIAWPLYAEQRMNAVLVAEGLKVGVRVKVGENGVVSREDIAKYVKGILEGEEKEMFGRKMKELKNAASLALSQNGSSTRSLDNVVQIWKNYSKN